MVGQLAQVCLPSHFLLELVSPVENSSPEVVELRAEVHRLQAENLKLRQEAGYWKSRHHDALKCITALEKKVEHLEGEKRQLQADLFGRRSETKPLNDRSNHLDDPQDDSQQPKLIPKGRYGISLWVEILLDKYFTYRPTERLLASWRLLGLNLAAGTVTDGLQRLELLLRPIYEAIKQRNPRGDLHQGDETRWPVFVRLEGKEGHGWWLWLIKGRDTVAYLLDPTRSHTVPENHYGVESRGVLVVDRYSAYKAMIWVKDGVIVLAFCWAHVRRDFIRVGKGWPKSKTWALEWLRRIRGLYRLNASRLAVERDSAAFGVADDRLRQAVAEMKTQMETELAQADLAPPCRRVLESLQLHWEGLTLFVDDPRIQMDNNGSERLARGPAVARKNFYGSGSQWSGHLAAALFSILATLSMWKLNPRKWLTWYFEHCAASGGKVPENIQLFLPWNLSEEQKKELGNAGPPQGDDTS